MQRSESEEGSGDAEEEEGPSLRSQLLLGHLLLLAANAVSGPAAAVGGPLGTADGSSTISSSTITSTMPPSAATTSIIPAAPTTALQPASVQVLAGHLRRSGLLPKWVFFLLKQLPQRPELFERAFNRLFQQVNGGQGEGGVDWVGVLAQRRAPGTSACGLPCSFMHSVGC